MSPAEVQLRGPLHLRDASLADQWCVQRQVGAHGLPCALGDANRLQWVLQNVRALEAEELLCWITGWSSEPHVEAMGEALRACGARALPHYSAPPADAHAPLLLSNPRWARPFEIFSRAFGMGEDVGDNELGRLAELEARVEHEFAQLAPAREASDAAHG